jgi:hypothetical protein
MGMVLHGVPDLATQNDKTLKQDASLVADAASVGATCGFVRRHGVI